MAQIFATGTFSFLYQLGREHARPGFVKCLHGVVVAFIVSEICARGASVRSGLLEVILILLM